MLRKTVLILLLSLTGCATRSTQCPNDLNIAQAIPNWPVVGDRVEVCPGYQWQWLYGIVLKTEPDYVVVRFETFAGWHFIYNDIAFKRYQLTENVYLQNSPHKCLTYKEP